MPDAAAYWPAAQLVHPAEPAVFTNSPARLARQLLHCDEPETAAYVPTAQLVQAVEVLLDVNIPGAHRTHIDEMLAPVAPE